MAQGDNSRVSSSCGTCRRGFKAEFLKIVRLQILWSSVLVTWTVLHARKNTRGHSSTRAQSKARAAGDEWHEGYDESRGHEEVVVSYKTRHTRRNPPHERNAGIRLLVLSPNPPPTFTESICWSSSFSLFKTPATSVKSNSRCAFNAPAIAPAAVSALQLYVCPDSSTPIGAITGTMPAPTRSLITYDRE